MDNQVSVPLNIFIGATLTKNFIYQDSNGNPIDITGYSAKLMGRQTVDSNNPPIVSISTSNYIAINGPQGLISVNVPANITSVYPEITGGVWDLFIYGTANIPSIRLVGGQLNIIESVTR